VVRGSMLVGGSSVSRGCWRADPDVRQAARMTMPTRGVANRCSAPLPGRQAEPVVPLSARVPPAVRWAAALRPRAESGRVPAREAALSEWRVNRPVAILAVMHPDQALINRWSGAPPFWEKQGEMIRQMFAPVTQALVEDGLAEAEGEGADLQARQWIEMLGHEIEGVKLRLSAPFMVHGKVVMETPEGAPAPKPPSVFLSPHPGRIRAGFITLGPQSSPDDVYPGVYSIVPGEPPPPYYLEAIRVGEVEPATPEVEFSSGAEPIALVYKTNGGAVHGAVEKCASGRVVLVPQDTAMQRPGFLLVAPCDSNGRYEATAVRPGEYYALAVPGDGSVTLNFDRLDAVFNQAAKITMRAGEASSADLRAIAPPAQ
jgi:hypothetical protein